MFHAPIEGSQFNPRAKIFRRFTPTETVSLTDGETILYQNNYYKRIGLNLPYVKASNRTSAVFQPIPGAITPQAFMTIKYHGHSEYNPNEPQPGDLLQIKAELWMVESGIEKEDLTYIRNMARVYLPLRKVL